MRGEEGKSGGRGRKVSGEREECVGGRGVRGVWGEEGEGIGERRREKGEKRRKGRWN